MEKMVNDFWTGKRVFLTGHTGFKGAWLALWLQKMGAQVSGYALEPASEPNLFRIAKIHEGMDSQFGDIRDFKKMLNCIEHAKPEIVIHMAAQAIVKHSYNFPIETYETNVMGTVNLLEACLQVGSVKAVVNVTSDKCYENFEREKGYSEDEQMGGYDPYSSSKGCAELVTAAYRRSFFTKRNIGLASARAGNVIGGGDWSPDRLFPDIFRAVTNKKPVLIRNPHAVRPWQHVLEPINGYLKLAQRIFEKPEHFSQGFNFGPRDEDARSVGYIVEKVTKNWGNGASYSIEPDYSGPHEANILRLDISKAGQLLKWIPKWSLDTTLNETVEWYKYFHENPSAIRKYTLQQIEKFEGA